MSVPIGPPKWAGKKKQPLRGIPTRRKGRQQMMEESDSEEDRMMGGWSDSDGFSSGDDVSRRRSNDKGAYRNKGKSNKSMIFVSREESVAEERDNDDAEEVKMKKTIFSGERDVDIGPFEDETVQQFKTIIESMKPDKEKTGAESSSTSNDDFRNMVNKASASKPSYIPPPVAPKEMKWEKNTKGFGSKYLSKFGFSGRLGAKETGVSGVFEVKVRPSGMGLGFGDFTEQSAMEVNRKLDAEVRGKEYVPVEKEKGNAKKGRGLGLAEERAASQAWKLGGVSLKDSELKGVGRNGKIGVAKKEKTRKSEVSFGSVFEGETDKQVILDMRGETPKYITDTTAINDLDLDEEVTARKPKLGQELLYNINLIVDMNDLEIQTSSARLKSLEDRAEAIKKEREELNEQVARDSSQLASLKSIDSILERMDQALSLKPLKISRDDMFRAFRKICVHFPEETKLLGTLFLIKYFVLSKFFGLLGIIDIIPTLSRPVIESEFSGWSPVENPSLLIDSYIDWVSSIKTFEEEINISAEDKVKHNEIRVDGDGASSSAAYQCLSLIFEQITLPILRRYLVNDWEVKSAKDATSCAALIRSVKEIYPKESFISLVEMTVLPKISSAVRYWSPTAEVNPIHEWILPWVKVIGRSISSVFPEIRRKISSALTQWNALDSSTYWLLLPWKDVFDAKSMEDFLLRNILPKLVTTIRAQNVEPSGQSAEHFRAVVLWHKFIPHEHMLGLLEGEFFPRWFKVLATWLSMPKVDYKEVSQWYTNWRSMFPDDLVTDPLICHFFNESLSMMEAAVAYRSKSSTSTPIHFKIPPSLSQGLDYFAIIQKHKKHTAARKRLDYLKTGSVHRRHDTSASTFKDVVEDFAMQNAVTFLPKRSPNGQVATVDGKPLWIFNDTISCYIDNNVLYIRAHAQDKDNDKWHPIDLDGLLLRSQQLKKK